MVLVVSGGSVSEAGQNKIRIWIIHQGKNSELNRQAATALFHRASLSASTDTCCCYQHIFENVWSILNADPFHLLNLYHTVNCRGRGSFSMTRICSKKAWRLCRLSNSAFIIMNSIAAIISPLTPFAQLPEKMEPAILLPSEEKAGF